jgi:uncharacterized protein YvpB
MKPLGAKTYVAKRYTEGEYVDGIWVEGSYHEFNLDDTSIQPVTGTELQSLPEGLRSRRPVNVYTTATLRTVHLSESPDHISYDDEWFEVQSSEVHNQNAPIPHSKYVCVRPETA